MYFTHVFHIMWLLLYVSHVLHISYSTCFAYVFQFGNVSHVSPVSHMSFVSCHFITRHIYLFSRVIRFFVTSHMLLVSYLLLRLSHIACIPSHVPRVFSYRHVTHVFLHTYVTCFVTCVSYICIPSFITVFSMHSLTGGYLGWFHIFAVASCAATYVHVQVSFSYNGFFFSD